MLEPQPGPTRTLIVSSPPLWQVFRNSIFDYFGLSGRRASRREPKSRKIFNSHHVCLVDAFSGMGVGSSL